MSIGRRAHPSHLPETNEQSISVMVEPDVPIGLYAVRSQTSPMGSSGSIVQLHELVEMDRREEYPASETSLLIANAEPSWPVKSGSALGGGARYRSSALCHSWTMSRMIRA